MSRGAAGRCRAWSASTGTRRRCGSGGSLPRWCEADSAWSLPATASDEERLLVSNAAPLTAGKGLIAIWARRREMAELLADACGAAGYATAWLHPRLPGQVHGAAAAIFDGDSLDAATLEELRQLAARVSPVPVLVLLQAPRVQDVRLAQSFGAVVLAKPFRVDELLWLLEATVTRGPGLNNGPLMISRKGAKDAKQLV